MSPNLSPISEEERNIDWNEVEYKIAIICNKFRTSVESRYRDDLAQELRIHAYYKSYDYYDLQRRAIDFWRSMKVNVMPEMPYFDLEFLGGSKEEKEYTDIEFQSLVALIREELSKEVKSTYANEVRELALQIFQIIVSDIDPNSDRLDIREWKDYAPYFNSRISCSYLWEVLGEHPGEYHYRKIRKAVKMIESVVRKLNDEGRWEVDRKYLE